MSNIDDFDLNSPVDRYLSSLNSVESIRTQNSKLRSVAKMLGKEDPKHVNWSDISYDQINLLINNMKRSGLKRNTINATISALKGVFTELMRKKQIDLFQYQLIMDIKGIKGDDSRIGKALSTEEVRSLFIAHPVRPIEFRNNAIIAVMIGCGLRRIEVCKLLKTDLRLDEKNPFMTVKGKGSKYRKVYIPDFAVNNLNTWIHGYSSNETPYVFTAITKEDEVTKNGLDTQTVYDVVKSRLPTATPHDLRRTFITRLLELDNDLSTVQKIAGHANPSTTVKYDKRGERQQLSAITGLKY